jgi:hypothetical protein
MAGAGTRDSSGGVGNVGQLAHYRGRAWGSCVLLAMLELQLLRRLVESIRISHYSPLARMHVLGYLAGLGYLHLFLYSIFSALLPRCFIYYPGRAVCVYLFCKYVHSEHASFGTLQHSQCSMLIRCSCASSFFKF